MSANERPDGEVEEPTLEDEGRGLGGQPQDGIHDGVHEVPLFLRDGSDGRKGDAQDEKDEAGE